MEGELIDKFWEKVEAMAELKEMISFNTEIKSSI